MAADMRPFEATSIGMARAETGVERFTKDGNVWWPKSECWRLNLTALSQRYNLYFVASGDEIHVYEPEFPFQKLGGKPCLIIKPQLANEYAKKYIPSQDPHCINHILVGSLGSQEILLLATDSGNVAAYHTSAILSIIHRNSRDLNSDSTSTSVGLRPFFSQWVNESAWGLAIHEEGRMIAVSANTPFHFQIPDRSSKITVFAFALSATETQREDAETPMEFDEETSYSSADWVTWDPTAQAHDLDAPARDCNYKIVLAGQDGHARNVPCITFLSSKQDKEGSWLLSTDIDGGIKMWRIWKGTCFRKWNYAVRNRRGLDTWAQSSEPGWFVAALDIHAFRPASDYNTLIGHHHARQYYGHDAAGESFDITRIVEDYVPSNSPDHPSHPVAVVDDSTSEQDVMLEDMSDSEVTADEEEAARAERVIAEFNGTLSSFSQPQFRGQSSSARRASMPQVMEADLLPNSPQMSDTTGDVVSEDDENDDDGNSSDLDQFNFMEGQENTEYELNSDFSIDEASDTDDNDGSDQSPRSTTSLSSYNPGSGLDDDSADPDKSPGQRRSTKTQAFSSSATNIRPRVVEIPDTPFIHCSTSQLRLFESTKAKSPHLFCARMLRQTFPPAMEGWNFIHMDRLSMVEQIPEIGVVIIASQVGRCAVCTMTKRKADTKLGLRVDWILPTRKEEQAGIRPSGVWLQGIATSPIQGRYPAETTPSLEQDDDENQPMDRVMNGMLTTFENRRVNLTRKEKVGNPPAPGAPERGRGNTSTDYNAMYRDKQKERNSFTTLELHHWPKAGGKESWRGIESSRRFRLMMTYADMTVLTYEIARGVEKHDTKVQIRA